jgi:hypothetical protein
VIKILDNDFHFIFFYVSIKINIPFVLYSHYSRLTWFKNIIGAPPHKWEYKVPNINWLPYQASVFYFLHLSSPLLDTMHGRPTNVYIHHHACKRSCNCQRCQLYVAKLCELPRCKKNTAMSMEYRSWKDTSIILATSHHKFSNITDIFDARFEAAIVRYQAKLGLQITGKLDFDTLNQIMAPTCGVPDNIMFHKFHASRH